jgi:hypothetical protein
LQHKAYISPQIFVFPKRDYFCQEKQSKKVHNMSEYEMSELIKRKEMLFRFLSFMQTHKDSYADNEEDFEEQVDAILDQIIRINYRLSQFDFFNLK